MTTTQHTPGPWESYPDPDAESSTLIVGRDGDIGTVWNTKDNEDCEANARLIAAAPDLLAALQAALEFAEFGHESGWKRAARAAIDKATKHAS